MKRSKNGLQITVKAKVTDDSKTKLQMLEDEHRRFQAYLHGVKEVELYSATKQQADRFLNKVTKNGGRLNPKKEYPLILRHDLIDVKKDAKFDCVYWMKVPVHPKSINLRIQTDCRYDLTKYSLRESKVVRQYDEWYIYITIEKEKSESQPPTNVLAIDLGVRHIAVTTNTANTRPNFHGKDLRRIRGSYFNLRRKLGQKKAFYKIKAMKNAEFKQVNHELHRISKEIVGEAKRTNAVIVVGKLKGIRQRIKGGRRVRRLVNNFPYYRLVQYIRYKAAWLGIQVMEISEAYSSQTCHRCNRRDKAARKTQGLFRCSSCGLETNADYNGSMNIMQRALGILSKAGGLLAYPKLPVMADRSHVIAEEPPAL
ncbi:MAG: transposase [Thermoproteota archaeon]